MSTKEECDKAVKLLKEAEERILKKIKKRITDLSKDQELREVTEEELKRDFSR